MSDDYEGEGTMVLPADLDDFGLEVLSDPDPVEADDTESSLTGTFDQDQRAILRWLKNVDHANDFVKADRDKTKNPMTTFKGWRTVWKGTWNDTGKPGGTYYYQTEKSGLLPLWSPSGDQLVIIPSDRATTPVEYEPYKDFLHEPLKQVELLHVINPKTGQSRCVVRSIHEPAYVKAPDRSRLVVHKHSEVGDLVDVKPYLPKEHITEDALLVDSDGNLTHGLAMVAYQPKVVNPKTGAPEAVDRPMEFRLIQFNLSRDEQGTVEQSQSLVGMYNRQTGKEVVVTQDRSMAADALRSRCFDQYRWVAVVKIRDCDDADAMDRWLDEGRKLIWGADAALRMEQEAADRIRNATHAGAEAQAEAEAM